MMQAHHTACSEMRMCKKFQLENRQRKCYLEEAEVYWEDINLYPTNAPVPFNAASYECTKKFKCPVCSCRGL